MAVGQHGTALLASRTPDRQAQITFPSLGSTYSYVEIVGYFFPTTENMLIRFHDCTERKFRKIHILTPFLNASCNFQRIRVVSFAQADEI
jgi:hypothetical protein